MINKTLFLITLVGLFFWGCRLNKTNEQIQQMDPYDFAKAWEKVNALEKQGLVKTMFNKVTEIHQEALDRDAGEDLIKALIYQGKYYAQVEEDGIIKTIESFQGSLDKVSEPERSIISSLLAELYDVYLNQNLWKFRERIEPKDQLDVDIRNWSPAQLVDQSTKLYLASVSYEGLHKIGTENYKELIRTDENASEFRNTLLDILGHRAILYFQEGKPFLVDARDRFILNDEKLFASGKQFVDIQFEKQNESRQKTVLGLYQHLIRKHMDLKNEAELLDLDINRLNYVYNNFISGDKDELYENGLKGILKGNEKLDGAAEVYFRLANLYYSQRSKQYGDQQEEESLIQKAHRICKSTILNYPGTYGAELCKSLKSTIERKSLYIKTEQVNLPDENLICHIEYKNVSKLYFRLLKLDRNNYEALNGVSSREISDFTKELEMIDSWSVELPGTSDYLSHKTEMAFKSLPVGTYALYSCDDPSFDKDRSMLQLTPFFVSNLSYWHTSADDKNYIYVVDRKTGKAIQNVKVNLYRKNYDSRRKDNKDLVMSLETDQKGIVSFKNDENKRFNYSVELIKGEEALYFENSLYSGRYSYGPSVNQKILYFMDRALYRPGQTVYFKGILLEENSEKLPKILPRQENLNIRLYDVNQQNTEDLTLNTNEFGSFSGSFTLPSSGLTGQMSIGSDRTRDRIYFNVEEYKRPKFFVELEPYKDSYKLGDKIDVNGSAISYAGVKISNATVHYRVRRTNYFPYWGYFMRPNPFNTNAVEIANGSTVTDGEGKFAVPVELLADDMVPASYKPFFRYEIEADVIDLTGETHTARSVMRASWMSFDVSLELAEKTRKEDSLRIEIVSNNWNGEAQELRGDLEIFKLQHPSKVYRERFWSKPDIWLYEQAEHEKLLPSYSYGDVEDPESWKDLGLIKNEKVNTSVNADFVYDMPAGAYKVRLKYTEPSGEEIVIQKFVSVSDEKILAPFELFSLEANSGEPGQVSEIKLQSAVPNLPVLLEVFDKDGRAVHEWKNLNLKEKVSHIIREKHRGNFYVRASYVYNNRFHTELKTILVPWSNKKLEFEYVHFRSVLEPGSAEKWTLKVKGPDKDIVYAEMLAAMYDASLDDIKKHDWWASIFRYNYMDSPINYFGFGQARTRNFVERSWNKQYSPNKYKSYKTINLFGLEEIPGYSIYREDLGVVQMAAPYTVERMMSKRAANGEMDMAGAEEPTMESEAVESGDQALPPPPTINEVSDVSDKLTAQPIRSNLNETVFFFPHLKTDKDGNVLIEFTMNEALTSWNFLGMAHTTDLKIGFTKQKVITQKELMVRPNPPQFVRMGDQLVFSSSISNLTDQEMTGQIELKLFDAATMKDITKQLVSGPKSSFLIGPDGNVSSEWNIRVPEKQTDLIVYQVWAKSGKFTDGEEGYLPVLSNRILITETMPLWVGPGEKKEFDFRALDKFNDQGLINHRFSIETTSDPVWYAIQAMPYVRDYSDRNCISLANALYANLLASHIVQENPAIEKVFNEWKQIAEEGSDVFASKLQKNQELKNILIRETPWLLDGMDEAAQKRNIALLFQLNQVDQDKRQIIQMLQGLQQYDGGFSWYPGGKSSQFITLYVLEMIGKLNDLKIKPADRQLNVLIQKALKFADDSISERYQKLLELAGNNTIQLDSDQLSGMDIYYLYARSLFKEEEYQKNAREASVYFLNQAEKYWLKKGLLLQGMMALTLHTRGNAKTAHAILRSLEERSIMNQEIGRYWRADPGYHWSELPIETQAMLVNAFDRVYEDKQIVGELQIWLLKHKQTNRWKTAKASVAAIHSLLLNRKPGISASKMLHVELGSKVIKPEKDGEFYEPGTGYFKKEFTSSEIVPEMRSVSVENPNDNIAWGAAYWQYFQDFDKIKSFGDTPVKLSRELFVVRDGKKGEELIAVDRENRINQGDKIRVRLRIEVDRPMDYIHLKDQKGAALETIDQISQYKWSGGLFYYLSPKDSSTDIFIENLPRGVFMIEYTLRAVHAGNYSNGIASIQSMYAPEFSSHSSGSRITIR